MLSYDLGQPPPPPQASVGELNIQIQGIEIQGGGAIFAQERGWGGLKSYGSTETLVHIGCSFLKTYVKLIRLAYSVPEKLSTSSLFSPEKLCAVQLGCSSTEKLSTSSLFSPEKPCVCAVKLARSSTEELSTSSLFSPKSYAQCS